MAKYTLFISTDGTTFRINSMLVHKASLKKIKRIEIIQSTFHYYRIKLEINRKIFGKSPKF